MSSMGENEKAMLVHISSKDINYIVVGAFGAFKWACAGLVLAARLIGLSMFTIWASDCFLREFHTTALCKDFVLFPGPGIFEGAWIFMSIVTSSFLIFYIHLLPNFPGFLVVLYNLIKRKYFYKIVFVLFLVCIYDLVVMSDKPKITKTIPYVLFMVEKSLTVTLVLLVNFLPSFAGGDPSQTKATLKFCLYKAALALYALECYTLAILGSTIAAYKVLTVSEADVDWLRMQNIAENSTDANSAQGNDSAKNAPEFKAVVDLMLLLTNNALRYHLAEFFLSKFFDQSEDILGGGTRKISESLARERDDVTTTPDRGQETQEASTNVPPNSSAV